MERSVGGHHPVVAGSFYPSNPVALKNMLDQFLMDAKDKRDLPIPRAIIAPHAGYIYSGPIAASAYACLENSTSIKRVAVFAPSHQLLFSNVAISEAHFFETPLGKIPVDREKVSELLSFPQVNLLEEAFDQEHALEVHLPYLQSTLKEFLLIPFIIGQISYQKVAEILENLLDDSEILIVISSDLSHYLDYKIAQTVDQKTAQAILDLKPEAIDWEQACGCVGIQALLEAAKKYHLKPKLIDLRNSGDTAGDKNRVVGYGAFHFCINIS